MAEIGIVPSPDDPYLELGASPQGTLVRKQILTINRQFVHPKTGKPITLGEDAWQQMKANFDSRRVTQIVQFPLADARNAHTEDPLRNAGECVGLERDGDKVFAVLDVRDPAVAEKIANKTLLGASAFLHLDAKDAQTGERRGVALLHVAGTNRPALVDLAPYELVVAACGPAWTELPDGSVCGPQVLMLCQSEVDPPELMLADPDQPDYQREPPGPDYSGGAGMDDDEYRQYAADEYLRDEGARLGNLAMRLGSGRGTRPEYAGIITSHDRKAALSAQQQITDEAILGLTREVAAEYGVRPDVVHAMVHDAHIRSGLGHDEVARVRVLGEVGIALSRGQLEVDDESVLKLTASGGSDTWASDDEILRLTSGDEDIFGLARHPEKAGKKVTTKTRAHSTDKDPGFDIEAEIERLLAKTRDMFGAQDRGAVGSGNTAHPAKSPQQREAGERRALAGGRPGGRSIPGLHPEHAPGHHESGSVRG
jgi:hypothetical protein